MVFGLISQSSPPWQMRGWSTSLMWNPEAIRTAEFICPPHDAYDLCIHCIIYLSLAAFFSAALVSHEITHASWPTRPSKRRQWIAPFIPGGVGVAALILRWKYRQFEKSIRHLSVSHSYVSCSLFSAALVSHEITHASWPTRPSKRRQWIAPFIPNQLSLFTLSEVSV